jgi:RNA polymerase sigma-B factor
VHLVETHLPLARSVASRHAHGAEPLEDLVQVGALGLVAAARRFDAARRVPFAAYALPTIEGEVRRHLRDRASTVRIPRREQQRARVVRQAQRDVGQQLGRTPSRTEAADAAGLTVDEAERALGGTAVAVPLALLDEQESDEAAEALEACERRTLVQELLAALTPREREAIALRYGADLPQREIGARLHLSQSQTSKLLAASLDKLRLASNGG